MSKWEIVNHQHDDGYWFEIVNSDESVVQLLFGADDGDFVDNLTDLLLWWGNDLDAIEVGVLKTQRAEINRLDKYVNDLIRSKASLSFVGYHSPFSGATKIIEILLNDYDKLNRVNRELLEANRVLNKELQRERARKSTPADEIAEMTKRFLRWVEKVSK